jgi:hypothetical protein
MAYTAAEGHEQILDAIAEAADEVSYGLADLGEAYEMLDENTADVLEHELFRPMQTAYGRLKATHSAFAAQHNLGTAEFASRSPSAPSNGVRGLIDNGVAAAQKASVVLVELQEDESMVLVEVGDAELRARISEIQRLLGDVTSRAKNITRTLGR